MDIRATITPPCLLRLQTTCVKKTGTTDPSEPCLFGFWVYTLATHVYANPTQWGKTFYHVLPRDLPTHWGYVWDIATHKCLRTPTPHRESPMQPYESSIFLRFPSFPKKHLAHQAFERLWTNSHSSAKNSAQTNYSTLFPLMSPKHIS